MKTLKSRFAQASIVQWIKGITAVVIYVLFIAWVGNFWWLLLTPFFFDAFVTKFIPWDWWKKIENKTLRNIMGWVDAILFSLIAVYFIFTFVFRNYQIPTSSLEKTLLVGDFLAVSKFTYGPRVPMTPLAFPLAHHTMPIIGTKAYFDKPQWEYRRLRGLRNIELNDIVVFNFPTGDTVASRMENPDYYTLVHRHGRENVWNNNLRDANGRPVDIGKIIWRPVDKRENYVKRAVALAGDVFEMRDNQIYINGVAQPLIKGVQHNYFIQTDGAKFNQKALKEIGIDISNDDFEFFPDGRVHFNKRYIPGLTEFLGFETGKPVYYVPLTQEMYNRFANITGIVKIVIESPELFGGEVFPIGTDYGWNRDNFGPISIPKKGDVLELTLENLPIYERLIRVHEHNKLEVRNGAIYINNEPATHYDVKMDYYWMMGDNRHNSVDSRFFGFVPEDHVVGTPMFVWLSLDKDRGWFQGKIRWNRFFRKAGR
jgi:signal peptidase I